MTSSILRLALTSWLPLASCLAAPAAMAAIDADAAQALLNKSDCLKCHAVDKQKDGPSFKEAAGKYKGKAEVQKIVQYILSR
jgi:cytochrome c